MKLNVNVNFNTIKNGGLGHSASDCLKEKNDEILTIIFTKGKLEIETKDIERINVYESSMNIIQKDKTKIFVNLENVTQLL